jgi:hypothetical protein
MPSIRFTVFSFVTRRFTGFRRVWLLTQAFDFSLDLLTLATAPSVTRGIKELIKTVRDWPDVRVSKHPLGGTQFNCRDTELGHVHSNGVVDIRLTASEQLDVLTRGLAHRHHVAPKSTWVTFFIEKYEDKDPAVSLLTIPFKRVTTQAQTPPASESPTEEFVP